MLFYDFLIILSKNHPANDETDDQDGSDSVSEGRYVRDFESQTQTIKTFFTFIGCLLYELTSHLKLHL